MNADVISGAALRFVILGVAASDAHAVSNQLIAMMFSAVAPNLETLFDQTYRWYRAGPRPAHPMVEHRVAVLHAGSSAELCL